ncbi:uncharacterized protein LOC133893707 [Phragmites australis]|uniref:uncharacterized protein LOC133893707 n=1 Tax=Phragmites australis TaxID=29695 RepID=UPI002D7799BE|nr:uncharacterized protein LOC133893707 [Phragmites australis]
MSTYPVLNDQPIDQWKVTELKDELKRRNLPINGLKDDLLKRLFEAIQGEILDGEQTNGETPPAEELNRGETPDSVDASVCQASMEQNVDEGPSEVTKQGDHVISVTEASDESFVAATEVSQEVVIGTQEVVIGTVEVSQRTLDAVAEVEAPPVDVALAATDENHCETNGVGLKSASSGNTIVKEVHPHSEGVGDTIEETPEDDTTKKMDVDDVPSDVTSINIKLGIEVDSKVLEQEAVTTPPDTIALHADVFAATEAEDDTIKKMAIDDVPSDFTSSIVKLAVNVDCKIEHEEVPTQLVAIAMHTDVVATAKSVIPENSFSENTLIYSKDHEDLKRMNGDCKTILCGPNDQVSEVNPDLGSQIQCMSICHDNMSNLNAGNSDLVLEGKQEMVKPSSIIPSVGDDLLSLDGDKELHKSGTSLQELASATNIDLDRKVDSTDGSSYEKLNLDRNSGDESMDEDVMESKHADSSMKSDDPRGKTEVTSQHVSQEMTLLDTVTEGSSALTEVVVAEEKPTPTEKRKFEEQEVTTSYEQSKCQCQRNADTVSISDQQASKLTGTGTPKELFQSARKYSFGKSDSTSGDSAKERIVPPPQKPATTSLRIDRFVRPFTLKAVQGFLGKTGSVCSFWMDHIKTHCYVTYTSLEEAVATRNAVYNLQWPPNNGSYLVAEFVDPQEVKLKHELPPPSQVPIIPNTATVPEAAPFQQSKANQTIHFPHVAATSRGLLPTPPPLPKLPPTSDHGPARERLPPHPKNLEPALTFDDLFKKTQAYPRIYYMPLSEEEVSAKLAARDNGKRG